MSTAPLRFGLIGVGGIGVVRAEALSKSEDCTLTAAFDLEPKRVAALAGKPQVFGSRKDFFESGLFDAVVISTPPHTHKELAVTALGRGIHVLVEKPMAESVSSCVEMIEAAEANGRILAVGFNQRYYKGVKVVRRAVQEAAIGKLSWIRAFAGHTGLSEFKAPWMYDKAVMGGGTLMDNGVHLLDLVRHIMADIVDVSAHVRNDHWHLDVEDNAFLHLTDNQGVVCDFHSSWTEWKGYRFFVEAYGDRGMAGMYYAPMFSRVTIINDKGIPQHTQRQFFPFDILREKFFGWQATVVDTFVEELGDFAARVRGHTGPFVAASGRDGLMACLIANAAYQSSESGRSVRIPADAGASDRLQR